jgi:cytochrome c-type biogenesis protein
MRPAGASDNRMADLRRLQSPALFQRLPLLLLLPLIFILISSCFSSPAAAANQTVYAPDFTAVGPDGRNFSLSDLRGEPLVLHITNIEVPLCRDCEKDLKAQVEALSDLRQKDPNVRVITINLRKNPYSKDGKTLAEGWWKINITWPWIEDMEPYQIGSKYIDLWNVGGVMSNPTIILIDKNGAIAGVYHVYRVGEGEVDGVQSADAIYAKIQDLKESRWGGLEGEISESNVSAFGMFLLGIVTSLAPCSIALMIAVFSYVLTIRRKDEYLRKSTSTSREGFMIGIAFTLGMAAVFFVLGLFISQVGIFIRDSRVFDLVAGIVMILLGISNLKPLEEVLEPVTSRIRKDPPRQTDSESLLQRMIKISIGLFKYSSFIGAFSLGIFFALGWAPCALSMVLPVLIWLASQNITPLAGGVMLFVFGIGHGVPIIPISAFSRAVGGRIGDQYVSVGKWTTKIFGLLVIAIGIVYAARYFGYTLW